ncbi:hypothetical protein [Pantoea sp. At-9b]|uniref:hypothetical protein n=1 Tax=Pantoea sp. (strain At-9b) TaxID=592316 RepID=UPI00059F6840|nr:hypothetical protein [Pantoea sp. At-9b]
MNKVINVLISLERLRVNKHSSREELRKQLFKLENSSAAISDEIERIRRIKHQAEFSSAPVKGGEISRLALHIFSILATGVSWPFVQKWLGF